MAYPSTFVDLQNAVAAKARMDTTDSAQLSKIKDWINRAYYDTCISTEALQESDTITLTANTATYTIPSSVVRINLMTVKQPNQTGYNVPLTLVPLMQLKTWQQSNAGQATTNGTAMYYALSGQDDLEIYPTPSTNDTLLMYYVKAPTALSADADVPAIPEPYATECLESGALVNASDYLKDMMSAYTFRQVYEEWKSLFRQHLRRREGSQSKQLRKQQGVFRPPTDPSVDVRIS